MYWFRLSEEKFWHNYLYRVSLLAKLVKEEAVNEPAEPAEQPQTSSQPSPQPTIEEPKKESQPEENVSSKDEIEQKPEKSSPSVITTPINQMLKHIFRTKRIGKQNCLTMWTTTKSKKSPTNRTTMIGKMKSMSFWVLVKLKNNLQCVFATKT